MKIGLIIYPPIYYSSLYRVSMDIAYALKELNHEVHLIYDINRTNESFFYTRSKLDTNIYMHPVLLEDLINQASQYDFNIVYLPLSTVDWSSLKWNKLNYYLYALYEGVIINNMNDSILNNAQSIATTTLVHKKILGKKLNRLVEYIPHTSNYKEINKDYNQRKNLLFLGIWQDRKNIPYLFQLISMLSKDMSLILLTQSYLNAVRKSLTLLSKMYKTRKRIILWDIGSTPSNIQLQKIFNEARIYISLTGAEGFELPLLDAMMSGLPVVKLYIPEVWHNWEWIQPSEAVLTYWGEYMIPKLDKEAINTITELYYDEDYWYKIRDYNNKFREYYSWNNWVKRIEKWIK